MRLGRPNGSDLKALRAQKKAADGGRRSHYDRGNFYRVSDQEAIFFHACPSSDSILMTFCSICGSFLMLASDR